MKKFIRILLWAIVLLVFIGTFAYLFNNSRKTPEVYEIVSPVRGDLTRTTVLTGKIEPRDEIAIKPQISGIVSEILVEAGDYVHEGDVIARIKIIPEASALSSAQNRVDIAQIALEDARLKHERNSQLYDKKIIAREEYETTRTAWMQAEKELQAARDAYRIVREGVSELNASESNTLVRATISGLVLDVPVKVGTSVILSNTFNDGTTIATVADMNNLIFRGTVDETEVGMLSVGMPVEVTIGAMPDFSPSGVIEYISPKGVESAGANTFEIKASISTEPGRELRAGYSANARVVLSGVTDVLTLPEGVIEYEGDSAFVYVLVDTVPSQRFERRAVTIGLDDGLNAQVCGGIDSTTMVRGNLKSR